eukprot:TRINITY_DN3075_c0_g1_i1.p2 TRINITY_DN3075_c0_g1~~TRINITY_DN3075_c0_g1_i1.p2  ORF type:complete len:114 (-),score=34.76 TRINITY_DN3075_c0_g1_i1:84-425(-)
MVSRNKMEYKDAPNPTHGYDTGAAWMSLALEASALGLVCHGMSGFDFDKARAVAALSEEWTVQAMAAVGVPAPASQLPPELASKEADVSLRKPLKEVALPLDAWLASRPKATL